MALIFQAQAPFSFGVDIYSSRDYISLAADRLIGTRADSFVISRSNVMDEVEFLFQCVRDKKLSKEQADSILKKSSPGVSLQKAATFSPGFSQPPHNKSGTGIHTFQYCIY